MDRTPKKISPLVTGRRLGLLIALAAGFATARTLERYLVVAPRRRRADAELERAERELANSSRVKTDFLVNMSHEIRTPLNGILGIADLLNSPSLNDIQREHVEAIRKAGRSLLATVDDILDYSKIEANKLELAAVDFNLHELVDSIISQFAEQASSKGVTLSASIATEVPPCVTGDPGRVGQVLWNLIDNAVKFTPSGDVSVEVNRGPSTYPSDRIALSVEVQDTGQGVAEVDRSKLFGSFSQADASTTRRFGGSGLGLAISKELTRLMGGDLSYEPRPGGGSVFRATFTFPEAAVNTPDAMKTSASIASGELPHIYPMNVLVVEDNDINQRVACGMLKQLGQDAVCVSDGKEALAAVRRQDFDVVFMDLQMPEMDGFEATRRIRALERTNHRATVVALTASTLDADRLEAISSGMDDFLTKPFTRAQLANVLLSVKRRSEVDVLDLDVLQQVRSVTEPSGPDSAEVLYQQFLINSAERIRCLEIALDAGDAGTAQREAHTLKGSSASLGATQLSGLALAVNEFIKHGDLNDAQGLLPQLKQALSDLRVALVDADV